MRPTPPAKAPVGSSDGDSPSAVRISDGTARLPPSSKSLGHKCSSCCTTFRRGTKALDEWEGTALGVFVKIRVRVQTLDGEVTAWLYVVDG